MTLWRDIKYNSFRMLNSVLAPVDSFYLSGGETEWQERPPAFIIGPPRSGTTLFYQLLISKYDVGYPNNLMGKFYRCPNLAARMTATHYQERNSQIEFASEYGNTPGLYGPHEFGEFWNRWFPKDPHYLDEDDLTEDAIQDIRQNISSLLNYLDHPILFKNVLHSMRIKALFRIFPNALFLVCERDPVFTAQSIYLTRKNFPAAKSGWWSVKPKEYNEIQEKSLLEQSVLQVYYVTRQIQEDAAKTEPDRFHWLTYETLCRNTREELGKVRDFLEDHGFNMTSTDIAIPLVNASNEQRLNAEEYANLTKLVDHYWN